MDNSVDGTSKKIAFSEIYMDSENENCRGAIVIDEDLIALAESIRDGGLIQWPIVSPVPAGYDTTLPYILVAGYRRCTACRDLLKWTEVPCVVRVLTKTQIIVANLEENNRRKDLNIMQEATAVRRLMRQGLKRQEIARELKQSAGWVQVHMMALELPEPLQKMIQEGQITATEIREIYSVNDESYQLALGRYIRKQRESGHEGKITLTRPIEKLKANPGMQKRKRDPANIENLLLHLADAGVPHGLHTRCLAWAAGNVSDNDLMIDIQEFMNDRQKWYQPRERGFPDMNLPAHKRDQLVPQ